MMAIGCKNGCTPDSVIKLGWEVEYKVNTGRGII